MNDRAVHALYLKDILKPLIEKIESLDASYSQNPAVYYESMIAYEELLEFLKARSNSMQFISVQTLKPFCDLLSERWLKIKKLPASYFNNFYSLANQAHFLLATCIAPYLGVSIWVLLIPTVNAISYIENESKAEDFHLYELMLIEEDPLEVLRCLDDAASRKSTDLFSTCGPRKQLSHQNKLQVINHSIYAANYYQAINLYIVDGKMEALEIARNAFFKAIKSETYVVNDSSNNIEENKSMVSYTISRLKTRDRFINVLMMGPNLMLISFLSKIDNDDLNQIMLGNQQLAERVKQGYNGDVAHDKITLFCYLEVYWRNRDKLDKYTSSLGWLADYTDKLVGGYSKEEKEAAVVLLQVFLLSPYNFDEFDLFLSQLNRNEIENFLKVKFDIKNVYLQKEQMKRVNDIVNLIETKRQPVLGALNKGSLNIFPQQVKLLSSASSLQTQVLQKKNLSAK